MFLCCRLERRDEQLGPGGAGLRFASGGIADGRDAGISHGRREWIFDRSDRDRRVARVLVKVAEAPEKRRAFGLVSRERALARGWGAVTPTVSSRLGESVS